jgi:hypothetical protein
VQRYADDNFYAFSRGNTLLALTNGGGVQKRRLTYIPYGEGARVCDV